MPSWYILAKFSIILLLPLIYTYNFDFTDYDYISFREKENLRSKFLERKNQNDKVSLFDKLNSKNTLFIDNILHSNADNSKVKLIEQAFRDMLAMKNVKYIFKRDFFWRTWRKVEVETGNKTVVCYKCHNPRPINCKKCYSFGYWTIEEKPPSCPYEIFSLLSDQKACVVNYTQYQNLYKSCPLVISIGNLKESCDNPIETKWRIRREYTDISPRKYDMCQGRENCDILTTYSISSHFIVFRIINSTNHIFYSKVMKSGNTNYACADDCGKIDPATKLVSKFEQQPFRLDLLKKNKRENLLYEQFSTTFKTNLFQGQLDKKDITGNIYYLLKGNHTKRFHKKEQEFNVKTVTHSQCKKIAEKYKDILYHVY